MGTSLRLLLHVAQKESWGAAIGNAFNFLKSANPADKLEVRLIANGDSVESCSPCAPELLSRLSMLSDHSVQIFLCENSLKAHGIDASSLPSFVKTVPAGIRALAELQEEGWRYVRP